MSRNEHDLDAVGALADPVRRDLYRYVCAQAAPVSRDQAASAVDVAVHRAKFHLDRLEEAGLLSSSYARVNGRTGPGAGRSAKLYRRADRDVAVTLPARDYLRVGRILAEVVAESSRTGEPVREALHRQAWAAGTALADSALPDTAAPHTAAPDSTEPDATPAEGAAPAAALDVVVRTLADVGYEPRDDGGRVVLGSCPYRDLAAAHPDVVCGLNHALVSGLVERLAPGGATAVLDPGEGRCCVTLATA